MDSHFLKTSLNSVFQEFGFKAKGQNSYLSCADVILIILQRKSTYGNCYYLDCGINLKSLTTDMALKPNDCHIKFNFNLLAGDEFQIIGKALDLRFAQNDDVVTLVSLIRMQCMPRFLGMSSLAALRDMHRQGQLNGAFVLKQARELLESN